MHRCDGFPIASGSIGTLLLLLLLVLVLLVVGVLQDICLGLHSAIITIRGIEEQPG